MDLREILDKLGIRSPKIRWMLYRWEQRAERAKNQKYLPTSLQWMRYENKVCLKCGAIVGKDDKQCPRCGHRVRSMVAYKLFRLIGLIVPEAYMGTCYTFLFMMVACYILSIAMQGASAIMAPNTWTLVVFGAWEPGFIYRGGDILRALSGGSWQPTLPMDDHQVWRMLSFGLFHIGLIHIGFNGMALTQIGPLLEEHVGRLRMLVAITFTQLGAAVASHLWYITYLKNYGTLSAGASGWLFGLIGLGVAYFYRMGGQGRVYSSFLMRWALYGLLFGLLIGANNAAHVGGFLSGGLIGLAAWDTRRTRVYTDPIWKGAAVLSALLWAVTLFYMIRFIITWWSPGGTPPEI